MKRLSILVLALATLTPLPALAGAPKQNPDAKLVARGSTWSRSAAATTATRR
ncbi:MAG: hypothetical protein U1F43_17220 [Myxococcota bacterium]